MYDELVKRLRKLHPEEFGDAWDFAFACQQAMHQAADAIEKLSRLQNASNWNSVEKDGLPSEPGEYIVYVRDGIQPGHPIPGLDGDLSYVTTAYFDPDACLWKENDEYYNGNLDCVNKGKTYYISHWADKPIPPKEET